MKQEDDDKYKEQLRTMLNDIGKDGEFQEMLRLMLTETGIDVNKLILFKEQGKTVEEIAVAAKAMNSEGRGIFLLLHYVLQFPSDEVKQAFLKIFHNLTPEEHDKNLIDDFGKGFGMPPQDSGGTI